MHFTICLLGFLALMVSADNNIESATTLPTIKTATSVEHSTSFETSHKRPESNSQDDDNFQTSHKISSYTRDNEAELDMGDLNNLQATMNLLPTKERPELNPVLSALINEDVMKSIEAKRAIEKEELEFVEAELNAKIAKNQKSVDEKPFENVLEKTTEASFTILTTVAPTNNANIDADDINVDFVDQTIALDVAGSENNKKSRIEIKKGPNGQDYEYEYVYYYEDEDDDNKAKTAESNVKDDKEARGKSRYNNVDRSTAATPTDNNLVNSKGKGRSSSVDENNANNINTERLPTNTRFPSRDKNVDTPPTPASDSLETAAEKKKISVKRPSLELVDSETFNTDEKQIKGTRNGDTEVQSMTITEQEEALAAEEKAKGKTSSDSNKDSVSADNDDMEQTTQPMEKAALDLYAILANENFNMDSTTDASMSETTILPDVDSTDKDSEEGLTTLMLEESTSTTTTTTTTTEAPTTTTSTTTAPPLIGGKRGGLSTAGRNRFKLKQSGVTTSTTTEAPQSSEPTKVGRNRFSRPPIGGRHRAVTKTTTAAPEPANEDEVAVKEVKPVSSAFGRGRPRNRFNLRGTTTTEKPASESEENAQEEAVSSTTARSLRGGRPTLNLRGRSRGTTTKAPLSDEKESADSETNEEKPVTQSNSVRPSRFNANRGNGNRLQQRGKFSRTTEAAPAEESEASSSNQSAAKSEGEDDSEKSDTQTVTHASGLNRLKNRPRLQPHAKTENVKPKVNLNSVAPRKINPVLAKKRLTLNNSTTETAAVEEDSSTASAETEAKDQTDSTNDESDSSKDDAAEGAETTTKQQPRGLGLLGQRRRLPLRKPGTIL